MPDMNSCRARPICRRRHPWRGTNEYEPVRGNFGTRRGGRRAATRSSGFRPKSKSAKWRSCESSPRSRHLHRRLAKWRSMDWVSSPASFRLQARQQPTFGQSFGLSGSGQGHSDARTHVSNLVDCRFSVHLLHLHSTSRVWPCVLLWRARSWNDLRSSHQADGKHGHRAL